MTKEEIDAKVEGVTIPKRFLETVDRLGDRIALRAKSDDDAYTEWSWTEYADQVARVTGGLEDLGVGEGDRVVLMMRNVPDFHFIDLAVAFCGATPVSIYNSSAPDQVQYLASHCEAKVAIVEDIGFLERVLKVSDELPALEHVVVLNDPDGLAPDDIAGRDALFGHDPVDLTSAGQRADADALATIIYTSGTTGPPKGVMLSHYNIIWTVEAYLTLLDIDPVGFRAVSYLPMAHIAERMTGHYMAVCGGFEVTDCPDPSLISGYLSDVHPETFFGVPRVWEKIHAGVVAALSADPERKQKFDEAVEAADPIVSARTMGTATDEQLETLAFLDEVAFKGVRELLGLDAVRFAITGAAPIPAELLSWFRAIGIPLSEIYGMSESSGPMTWEPYRVKPGTVGVAFPGCEVKLADDGEIVCRGGNVFLGYLNAPDKTAETLDDDGWLHSGDIGEIDDEGYFRIVDRKKELIITAGGKNISPANLESALKTIPLVGQACAIGDQRKFVSALIVLDPDVAPVWARENGKESASLADLSQDPDVRAEIEAGLSDAMTPFNNAEKVKKIAILPDEWMPDSEELTPTSKLKRRGIHQKYADDIEAMYA